MEIFEAASSWLAMIAIKVGVLGLKRQLPCWLLIMSYLQIQYVGTCRDELDLISASPFLFFLIPLIYFFFLLTGVFSFNPSPFPLFQSSSSSSFSVPIFFFSKSHWCLLLNDLQKKIPLAYASSPFYTGKSRWKDNGRHGSTIINCFCWFFGEKLLWIKWSAPAF